MSSLISISDKGSLYLSLLYPYMQHLTGSPELDISLKSNIQEIKKFLEFLILVEGVEQPQCKNMFLRNCFWNSELGEYLLSHDDPFIRDQIKKAFGHCGYEYFNGMSIFFANEGNKDLALVWSKLSKRYV